MGIKVITEEEAFKLYLDSGYDEIYPFDSVIEFSFLDYLNRSGYKVLTDEDIQELSEKE